MDAKRKMAPYQYRWAVENDWIPAMNMIWKTFLKFEGNDYTHEGIRNFFDFITGMELHSAFQRGEYKMLVALDGDRIIGAGSLRNQNHLSLLFVDESYHRRGVGSSILLLLCEYLKEIEQERYMTVKAAPYAIDFYRKLGFRVVKPEEQFSGIKVTSMEKMF